MAEPGDVYPFSDEQLLATIGESKKQWQRGRQKSDELAAAVRSPHVRFPPKVAVDVLSATLDNRAPPGISGSAGASTS